jgi:alanyl-tRNA synthetase
MTRRLYYDDSYLTDFRAAVVDSSEDRRSIVLDQTAFYPSSGGQPNDLGSINGVVVTDVVDTGDRVVHVLASAVDSGVVEGTVDRTRRFDHMQQHTGQHLLSAVLVDLFGIATVSFHMGADSSTIDVEVGALDASQIRAAEQRANDIVFENRPVSVSYSDSADARDLRKPSEREGVLRIITIEGLDRSACGGTHVQRTGEIGPILVRKTEKVRGNTRLEFLCGSRAVRRARIDMESLTAISQAFSSTLDDAPEMVASSLARLKESEKIRQKLAADLAELRGRQLYRETTSGAAGIRRFLKRIAVGGIDEETRWEAQSFVAHPKAIYIAVCENPVTILLAVSPDSGIQAGPWLSPQLKQAGGKGGGNARMAQGSLPEPALLAPILQAIGFVS